jgi:proline iminopeptidase
MLDLVSMDVGEFVGLSDGTRLWTSSRRVIGTPAVVLVHGGPGMWDYLEPVAHLLPQCTTHRYDQRGCGRSVTVSPTDGDYRLDRFVSDLEELRGRLGHDRWTVFGHSFGADLALNYAARHPERVEALVYCSGTGLDRSSHRQEYRERVRERLGAPRRQERLELTGRSRSRDEEIRWRMLSWLPDFTGPDARAHAAAAASVDLPLNLECNERLNAEMEELGPAEERARCATVTAPALVLHGALDPRPVPGVGELVETLPRGRLVVLDGAGHQPWVEQPTAFATAVRGFLGS